MKPFLTAYQTDTPMLPYLYDELLNLVKELMAWSIKNDVLEKAQSGMTLCKVDVHKKENHVITKNIDVGFAAQQFLRQNAARIYHQSVLDTVF